MRDGNLSRDEMYLARAFHQRGYMREPSAVRRKRDGQKYKKGCEVRLVASSEEELAEIRRHLRKAGFNLARPYKKGTQIVQPVYGKRNMKRFRGIYTGW